MELDELTDIHKATDTFCRRVSSGDLISFNMEVSMASIPEYLLSKNECEKKRSTCATAAMNRLSVTRIPVVGLSQWATLVSTVQLTTARDTNIARERKRRSKSFRDKKT